MPAPTAARITYTGTPNTTHVVLQTRAARGQQVGGRAGGGLKGGGQLPGNGNHYGIISKPDRDTAGKGEAMKTI